MVGASEGKRRALILPLATTGLRIREALDVRWSDSYQDPQGNVGLRVVGKGRQGSAP
jgi:integrase